MTKDSVSYSFSSDDIRHHLPGIDIMLYSELDNLDSLDQLFQNPHNATVILYETKPSYGHWVCVLKRTSRIVECFDSYGLIPDDQLSWISKTFRVQSDQDRPHLTKLLYESPYQVRYNQHRLQSRKLGTNTCGRWCIARIKNATLSEDQFATRIRKEAKQNGLSPDQFVVKLVGSGGRVRPRGSKTPTFPNRE